MYGGERILVLFVRLPSFEGVTGDRSGAHWQRVSVWSRLASIMFSGNTHPVPLCGAVRVGTEVPEMHVVQDKTVTPRHANSTHPNGVCCAAYCCLPAVKNVPHPSLHGLRQRRSDLPVAPTPCISRLFHLLPLPGGGGQGPSP